MSSDIRVKCSFRNNRKRKRLSRLLGYDCAGHLLDLWIETSLSRHHGQLLGWDDEDIADASGWTGDPAEWVRMLLDVGFLDRNGDDVLVLHDWEDHQGYVCRRDQRVKRARTAAAARYKNKWKEKKQRLVGCASCDGKAPAATMQLDDKGQCQYCRRDGIKV